MSYQRRENYIPLNQMDAVDNRSAFDRAYLNQYNGGPNGCLSEGFIPLSEMNRAGSGNRTEYDIKMRKQYDPSGSTNNRAEFFRNFRQTGNYRY